MQFGNTTFTKRLSYGGGGGGGGGSAHGDDPNSGGSGGHGGGLIYLLLEELTLDGTIESKGNTLLLSVQPFHCLLLPILAFRFLFQSLPPPTIPPTPHSHHPHSDRCGTDGLLPGTTQQNILGSLLDIVPLSVCQILYHFNKHLLTSFMTV